MNVFNGLYGLTVACHSMYPSAKFLYLGSYAMAAWH